MSKHVIFVFTGTGNSLWAAKRIAAELENCEVVPMGARAAFSMRDGYDTIGFVYPTYYRGMPSQARGFVERLDFAANKGAYCYAVATCGRVSCGGNSISQLYRLLNAKGVTLNYAQHLDMFANYVVMYDMRETVAEETRQSAEDLKPIVKQIVSRGANAFRASNEPFQQMAYRFLMRLAPKMDKRFNVSDACTGCGVCAKVCPAANITTGKGEKPVFLHNCEQCLACIHNCPAKAVNYKTSTQGRRRYVHPEITWRELAALNGRVD